MAARDLILQRLKDAGRPLAVHELNVWGVSDNSAASRLVELAQQGLVKGRVREGKRFKEWFLVPQFQTEPNGQMRFV